MIHLYHQQKETWLNGSTEKSWDVTMQLSQQNETERMPIFRRRLTLFTPQDLWRLLESIPGTNIELTLSPACAFRLKASSCEMGDSGLICLTAASWFSEITT